MKKLRHKYGITGYGLYWYCIELIAGSVNPKNITFELEEDAEIIALEWSLDQLKVQEIIAYMVQIGLFDVSENSNIRCFKLAKRLDDSNAKNIEVKRIVSMLNGEKKGINPINSEKVRETPTRLEENRLEENRIDNKNIIHRTSEEKPKPIIVQATPKHSEWDMEFAVFAYQTILQKLPDFKKPNLETWAKDCRLMRERDNRNENLMGEVWQWARDDNFWSSNILSIKKFREKFDQLNAQRLKPVNTGYQTANEKAAAQIAKSLSCDKPEDFLF